MQLHHIGIINKSEDEAYGFYHEFLGLEKEREYIVSPELSMQVFSVARELKALVFGNENIKIEVFILSEFQQASPNINHFSLHVKNLPEILDSAKKNGIKTITGKHNEKTVYFLQDFAGNMIEIKQIQ